MIAFLIVLGFNIYWYNKYGKEEYFEMYSFKYVWLSIMCWAYYAFGIACLLIDLI